MNEIYNTLALYSKYNLTNNKPSVLIHRLNSIKPSQKELYELSKSIKYPYKNGLFVICLDFCSKSDFYKFVYLSQIPNNVKKQLKHFYKKLHQLENKLININTFKLKSFRHKTINASTIKPKLSSKLYIK